MNQKQMLMACGDGLGAIGLALILLWWQEIPCVWPGEWLYYGTGLIALGAVLHIPYFGKMKPYFYVAIGSALLFAAITVYGLI